MQKERLKKEVVKQLLSSNESIGIIADLTKKEFQTIRKQIISESPTLCKNAYVDIIKKVLCIKDYVSITELYNTDGGYKE